MSNPIKCPCDCPACALDDQDCEKSQQVIDNNERVPDYQNCKENQYITGNCECETDNENNEKSKNFTDYNKSGLSNENNSKTQIVTDNDKYVSDKQKDQTYRLLTDYKECLNKLQAYVQGLKTEENVTKTHPEIEIKKHEDLNIGKTISHQDCRERDIIHENKKCLNKIKERFAQVYAVPDQKCECAIEKMRREQGNIEETNKHQYMSPRQPVCYKQQFDKIQKLKCPKQDKLQIQQDALSSTYSSPRCHNQDKLQIHEKPSSPASKIKCYDTDEDVISPADLSIKCPDPDELKGKKKCHEKHKSKIDQDASSQSKSNIKCQNKHKSNIDQDASSLSNSKIKCQDKQKSNIEQNAPNSLSSSFKDCISGLCSKICKTFKDFDKSLCKHKYDSPASSDFTSKPATESLKSSKTSICSKSKFSNSDTNNTSADSASESQCKSVKKETFKPAKQETVIISRAQQKFYEYENQTRKACKPKSSLKTDETGKNTEENNTKSTPLESCKKSWW